MKNNMKDFHLALWKCWKLWLRSLAVYLVLGKLLQITPRYYRSAKWVEYTLFNHTEISINRLWSCIASTWLCTSTPARTSRKYTLRSIAMNIWNWGVHITSLTKNVRNFISLSSNQGNEEIRKNAITRQTEKLHFYGIYRGFSLFCSHNDFVKVHTDLSSRLTTA